MDPRMQTSFIPKRPIVASPKMGSSSAPINLFSLVATILFIGTIALSGGVFFYKNVIQKQIDEKKATLELAKGAFEPETINQIVRLDSRIEASKQLFSSHVAVTPLFDFLSSVTLRSVRFKDFSFLYISPTEITIIMKGEAQGYTAVALQSDFFNKQESLSETIIGDMALDPSGLVNFSVTTNIDPNIVSYANTLVSQTPATETPVNSAPVNNVPVNSTSTNATSTSDMTETLNMQTP